MTEYGYAGNILKLDLSNRDIRKIPTDDYSERFLGGHGIAAKLYWDMVPPQTRVYDEENCLICASGPVAGFPGFAGFRWKVCGKSVEGDRESFSYCNLGEKWGSFLKFNGYDALTIRGVAEKPTTIFINDNSIEYKDASSLWGKSTFEAIDTLKAVYGKNVSVLTIGPAAENLVPFATMLTDEEMVPRSFASRQVLPVRPAKQTKQSQNGKAGVKCAFIAGFYPPVKVQERNRGEHRQQDGRRQTIAIGYFKRNDGYNDSDGNENYQRLLLCHLAV